MIYRKILTYRKLIEKFFKFKKLILPTLKKKFVIMS